jgi:hypothetical protein
MTDRTIGIKFGNQVLNFIDLGHNVNDQFVLFYQSMFGIPALDIESFKANSHAYFNYVESEDKKFEKHDDYFNNFTPVWINLINQKKFTEAENIWKEALDIALEWEKERSLRIHKGTPYYFWAVTCFLNENLEKGFWLMNQAFVEDTKKLNMELPDTPAKNFLHFETTPEQQFFRNKLLEIKEFLNQKLIAVYSNTKNRKFDYSVFESKFLKNKNVNKDVKFHFNLNIFRLKKILELPKPDNTNTIASLLYLDVIFDLCKVFEFLIRQPNNDKFSENIKEFSKKYKNNTLLINLNSSNFNTANFINNFQKILGGTFTINNNAPDDLEKDILVTYGFRNFGAHKIEENELIVNNFENIIKSIVNSIFLAVELYS